MESNYCINYGGGVDSTAILGMLCSGKLPEYGKPLICFADTGAERDKTYEYLEYIKPIIEEAGHEITTVKSKEGSLYDYCNREGHEILPMRCLRWCTDRWKRKPLDDYRKGKEYFLAIGIDAGEQHRATRWMGDKLALFPLIDAKMNREDCVDAIKDMGWKVPIKSGCWFCPYEKMNTFKDLKRDYPEKFKDLCRMEQVVLKRLEKIKQKG